MEDGEFASEIDALWDKIDNGDFDAYFDNCKEEDYIGMHPDVLAYILALPITEEHLKEITWLTFDEGSEVYGLIAPNWDCTGDLFKVTSLDEISLLPNLEFITETILLNVTDAKPLLSLKKLETLDIGYGKRIGDVETIELLKEKGVKILNERIGGEQVSDNDAEDEYNSNSSEVLSNQKFNFRSWDEYEDQFDEAVHLIWSDEEPEEGLKILDKLLEIDPKDQFAWLEKGNALDALERTQEAEHAWLSALAIDPEFYEALYGMANVRMREGRYEEAMDYIQKALECDPTERASPLHVQAQLYGYLGDKKKSTELFQELLGLYHEQHENDSENAEPMFQLACVYAVLGNENSALEYLKKAVGEDPDSAIRAKEDKDFEILKNNPEFKKLISEL